MKACEIAKLLRGKFKFVSDEMTIQQLLNDGKPMEYARDYIIAGCNTPTVPGYSQDTPGGMFNLPLMLELALNKGASRLTGEQIGPKTGNPRKFKSYDEVWNAYKKQVESFIPVFVLFRNVDSQLYAEFAPTPFQSALFHGCIEKGLDITNGGTAPYKTCPIGLAASPNVGDSLAAIKKAVFEDKKITMDRLVDALDKNFEGEEEILHILESAPKFGNDDDYVDSIVNEVLIHGSNTLAKYKGFAGAIISAAATSGPSSITLGQFVGALPDGRRAGEPLSEGGISPYQGRNVNGPAATMRSVAKLDHVKLTDGSVLNMRFNPDVLKDESKIRKFASLVRTFCETGGFLVQFNIVSTDMLRDAQRHPEKYRDLLVRVSTWSAYFVELGPELQNDIIARTEFQEV
jgi:formate C-acetyltransferase